MQFENLPLTGATLITPPLFPDERGYFTVPYQREAFARQGLATDWVQDNQSLSVRGVLRGFHFQLPPHTETKLVRVIKGAILDVIVDLRTDSATFGQHFAVQLTDENRKMLYIPRGFAHAFYTLSETALVHYKVDNDYTPQANGGIIWDDPDIGISWPTPTPLLSEKDRELPPLSAFESPFRMAHSVE